VSRLFTARFLVRYRVSLIYSEIPCSERLKTLEVVGGNRRDGETRSFGESWNLFHAKIAKGGTKSGKELGTGCMARWI